jgi:periplasmic protein TonB
MFESTLNSPWNECSCRGLTTLTSFGTEAIVVAVLLLVPLFRPLGVPLLRHLPTPISLSPVPPAPVSTHSRPVSGPFAASGAPEIILRQPDEISARIASGDGDVTLPIAPSGPYIPGVRGPGSSTGAWASLGTGAAPVIPRSAVSTAQTVRLSHMSEGDLVHKVVPTYPPLARTARIQGAVILQAMISKSGAIEHLRLLSGHPMLAGAAIEAVRQWRYRPYFLNGEPVEVETQITVNFSLAGN